MVNHRRPLSSIHISMFRYQGMLMLLDQNRLGDDQGKPAQKLIRLLTKARTTIPSIVSIASAWHVSCVGNPSSWVLPPSFPAIPMNKYEFSTCLASFARKLLGLAIVARTEHIFLENDVVILAWKCLKHAQLSSVKFKKLYLYAFFGHGSWICMIILYYRSIFCYDSCVFLRKFLSGCRKLDNLLNCQDRSQTIISNIESYQIHEHISPVSPEGGFRFRWPPTSVACDGSGHLSSSKARYSPIEKRYKLYIMFHVMHKYTTWALGVLILYKTFAPTKPMVSICIVDIVCYLSPNFQILSKPHRLAMASPSLGSPTDRELSGTTLRSLYHIWGSRKVGTT